MREKGTGAALFGYTSLYGQVPGGQAEYLRVPQAHFGPIKVPHETPDERFLFLSDVLPTAWQAVRYAGASDGSSVAVIGLGPIGQMCGRIARYHGARVIGVDPVAERRAMAERYGMETLALEGNGKGDVGEAIKELTGGRGADSVIDAVGMEAHGSPLGKLGQTFAGLLPDSMAQTLIEKAGIDRLQALFTSIEAVRRGGTIAIVGVYGGMADPLPLMTLFDKQIQLRMGQANVKRWVDDLLPLVTDESDPLGVEDLATHRLLFYPDRAEVVDRFLAYGYDEPQFEAVPGSRRQTALVYDPDGHAVELVIAPDEPQEVYETIEIGLTVSDLERSRDFYRDFVGLEELSEVEHRGAKAKQVSYRHGTTIVSLHDYGQELPADTGTGGIQYVVTDVGVVDKLTAQRGVKVDQPLSGLEGFDLRTIWLEDPDGITNYFAETAQSRQAQASAAP